MSEQVVVSGSVSPSGVTRTTHTTTYNVRTVPCSACVVVGEGVRPPSGQSAATIRAEVGTVEDLKKYIEETREKLLRDPRTKQMIDKGEATWEEVKAYLKEHGPHHQIPSGPTSSSSTYTYSTGYWYPLTHSGAFTAAPNTVFEVACGDAEITKKITLRPQVDVVFDSKASQLVFAFDLPGFVKKDISVEIENRCIAVSGDRPKIDLKVTYGENMKNLVTERSYGFFCRHFQLPPNAIEDTVSATMENGVLFVRISTSDSKAVPEKKRINIE